MDDAPRRVGISDRMMRWLPWLAGTVLIVGVAVSLVTFLGVRNTAKPLPSSSPSTPIQRPVKEKTVPLAPAARLVAKRFILTAVARRNLAEAYDLVGPQLRQGLTRAQWENGNIPVVPFPVSLVQVAPMKVGFSYRSHVLLEVTLLPSAGAQVNGVKVKPQLFYLELRANGKGKTRHWVVTNWVPGSAPSIPLPG